MTKTHTDFPAILKRIMESRAFIFGVEGELILTEQLNYEKWKLIAKQYKIVGDDIEFLNLWGTSLVGIGDDAIYKVLATKFKENTGENFISWDDCKVPIIEYYKSHQHEGKAAPGSKEFIEQSRQDGKPSVIATHGEEDLVKIQKDFLALNGVDLSDIPVVYGNPANEQFRKDKEGYLEAFRLLQQKIPDLKPEQVTVFDDSPKYVLRAQALGMNTAHISKDLADHLRQHTVADTVSWKDTMKKLVVVASVGLAGLAKAGAHLIPTLRL